MKNITQSLPKKKEKVNVNFKSDPEKLAKFQAKLKKQKVTAVDFFNTAMDMYLNEK